MKEWKFWSQIIVFIVAALMMHTNMSTKVELQQKDIDYIRKDINDIKRAMGLPYTDIAKDNFRDESEPI